jgi:ABC-type dipeptide/oligopeptide/nickel transport system ATPase component
LVREAAVSVLLSVKDLRVRFETAFGPVHAVRGVSFELRAGRALGIVGESGKSVSCYSIVGLYPEDAEVHATGSVRFEGAELLGKPTDELAPYRGAQISYLMQDPRTSLNPYRPVRSQLVRAIRLDGASAFRAERCAGMV